MAYLRECERMTGEVIRSSRRSAVRYEGDRPGELIHMVVQEIGKIPDGGVRKEHDCKMGLSRERRNKRIARIEGLMTVPRTSSPPADAPGLC